MRFKLGEPTTVDPAEILAAGGKPLPTIPREALLNRAALAMAAMSLPLIPLWAQVMPEFPSFDPLLANPVQGAVLAGVFIMALILAHEVLHQAGHPGGGLSARSVLGYMPARFLFYSQWTGPLTRRRMLVMALLPFLVLTVAPLVVAAFGVAVPMEVAWMSAINGALSGGDLYFAYRLVREGPLSQVIWYSGWAPYVLPGLPQK